MKGEIFAGATGFLVGYFTSIKEGLEVQSQLYLGNELTKQQLSFHNDPLTTIVANVILYTAAFALSYNVAKNVGGIIRDARFHYALRRSRELKQSRQPSLQKGQSSGSGVDGQ